MGPNPPTAFGQHPGLVTRTAAVACCRRARGGAPVSEPKIHRPADAGQLRELVAWAVAEERPLEIAGQRHQADPRPAGRGRAPGRASPVLVGHHPLRARRAGHVGRRRHAARPDRGRARRARPGAGVRARRLWCPARRRPGRADDRRGVRLQPRRAAPAQGRSGARPPAGPALRHRPRPAGQDRRPRGQERHRLRPVQAADRLLRHAGGADPGHLQGDAAGGGRRYPAGHRRATRRRCSASCAPPAAARARSPVPPTCRRWRPGARRSRRCAGTRRGTAAIRLEGFGPSIAYRRELLERLLARARHRVREPRRRGHRARCGARSATWPCCTPERLLWRLSVPPTAAGELAAWTASLTNERLFDWAGRPDLAGAEGQLGRGGRDHPRGPGRARRPRDAGPRAGLAAARGRAVRAAAGRRFGR